MHSKKLKNKSKKSSTSYMVSASKKKRDERINKKFLIHKLSEQVKYLSRRKHTAPQEGQHVFNCLIEKFEHWKQNIEDMPDNESLNYKDIYIKFQNEKKEQEIHVNNAKICELENQIVKLKIYVEQKDQKIVDLESEIKCMKIDSAIKNQKTRDPEMKIEEFKNCGLIIKLWCEHLKNLDVALIHPLWLGLVCLGIDTLLKNVLVLNIEYNCFGTKQE
ncbi:5687_t:CDS:2 [Cetraspora pellucida]|uniref:5687_t:CDS:1 n=1 Tax=Cetraspora pellucida TaxID=1433469 RepID=A0ACA9K1Z7_9GLOM|nr:5687_t:CDS:2 [Cetraspora pellucida]